MSSTSPQEPSRRVAALRAYMPHLISAYPDRDLLLEAFEAQSELILADIAAGEQRRIAWRAIQFILIDLGYVPMASLRASPAGSA